MEEHPHEVEHNETAGEGSEPALCTIKNSWSVGLESSSSSYSLQFAALFKLSLSQNLDIGSWDQVGTHILKISCK